MIGHSFEAAVDHLRSHGVKFEPGLGDDEITRIEGEYRFRFPPDFRRFLQTALPVSGGFPNWRSESANDLRNRFLDRRSRGVLFDVEHNDFWSGEWGPRPAELAEALAEAERRLDSTPPLIPIRSHHYLPSDPAVEGNPVLSVRQSDIACVGRDLPSYLMGLFGPAEAKNESLPERHIPFWADAARTGRIRVPNLAGPVVVGAEPEYDHLCRVARAAGFWAEAVRLLHGSGVTFDRTEPPGNRKSGVFWVTRRDFGWLVCVRCPRYYFAPDADRVPELCLALLNDLPHEELQGGRLPFSNFRLGDGLRREFGLVAIQHFTQVDDERERKVRAWEREGWREMSHGQTDVAWDGYGDRFGYPAGGPFQTPTPSATWDIAHVYLRGKVFRDRVEADLTSKALAALKECTRPGEEVFALDWNHPCYFFDPHAATDAGQDAWPVPVLPDGDHYIFLAQDHRFGIVGNCVDMTVCVFGQGLLAAFDASRPEAFSWPTPTAEARRVNEHRRTALGWQRLTTEEKEDIWEQFDSRFRYDQSRFAPNACTVTEPTPSVTWAVAPGTSGDQTDADTRTMTLLGGLQKATKPGERLFALAPPRWFEHYTFDPHRLGTSSRDSWAVSVNPDDGFAILLAPDLRFGVVVNPVEKTICVFGEELLAAMGDDTSSVFGRIVRRNGTSVPN